MKLSEILYRWELVYDILKNKWKDGRHFADPEHTRMGFIELYDKVAQLEAENERLRFRECSVCGRRIPVLHELAAHMASEQPCPGSCSLVR